MKILLYSDIHSADLKLYNDDFDLLITLGDIYWEDLKKIDNHYSCRKIGVLGNHDGKDYLAGTSIENMHGKTIHHMGYTFAGLEGSPRYNQKYNSAQYYEEEMEDIIENLQTKVDILIAHSNLADYISDDLSFAHRGFHCIKRYITKNDVKFYFHGHEHDPREYNVNATTCHCVFRDLIIEI